MRTFLQGLTTERGPLSSALLDFATSAREEDLLSASAFRSPVEEFFHDRERGPMICEASMQGCEDLEKGADDYSEPGPVPATSSSCPSAFSEGTAPEARPAEMESQETDYTMNVADSCASTEGSSIVQESRGLAKPRTPKASDLSRHCLNIIAESKEWGEMSSSLAESTSNCRSPHSECRGHGGSPRAAQIEVKSSAAVNHIDPNVVRCWNWCLFFLEMWISTGCIVLCATRKDWLLCLLLALPHTLLVGIEVQLIGRDWAFRRNLHALQGSSRGKALFFKSIVFLVFGFLSCLPVMRARQCWKQRGMRASLVDEIETSGEVESARFDSHVMFVTNVPRIMVLLYASTSLVYTELQLSVLLSMAFLSLLNVLQAAINFDYYASKWIRAQYEMLTPTEGFPFQFQVLHHTYRLCEIALRILTLLLVTEALRFHPFFGGLYLCLDYLLGTAALAVTKQAPGSSRMVLILSVSIYVFDCCRFIDEQGLTRQARQVSNLLRALRSGQTAVILPLLWFCVNHPSGGSSPMQSKTFWPTWALLLGLLALVWLLEKCTRLQHRAVDIFMACKKGMVQEVVHLLDSGCDSNLQLDDGTTPLHVAAGCGQSECVEVLLRRGADPLLTDVDGETALHKACRHSHARCIRVMLHPPVDAPCVLRGDFLECAVQVNKKSQRPLQLLEGEAEGTSSQKAEKSQDLIEELAGFQHQPDVKRSLSSQLSSQVPTPTRSVSGELHGVAQSVFGQVLKNSESRFLVASKHTGVGTGPSLTGFLFTTGIGEQMAEVLDNEAPGSPQLTTLRTQGVLGAGAFGKVFKVLDVCSSEVYALKLQRRDSTTKFAIREAEALHRSSHAFIVRLIHIFQTQSYYALLMELCDKSLNACILDGIDGSGQILGLTDQATKRYAACITLALEYLHKQQVVFRDLKPDNVLVTFKDNVAKLADFGLARSLTLDPIVETRGSEESGSDKLSPKVSSTVCGTPRFMAPEVYDELRLLDSDDEEDNAIKRLLSRDWYALGCCLLLMLLGQEAGSLAEANGRRVLLPPSGQAEITCCLRKASKKGRIDEDALHLIDSLTAPVEVRFDASDLRRQPFLEQVIMEMEQFASP